MAREPRHTVKQCEDRLDEIDEKIRYYEDIPQVARDGPVSMNFLTRIEQLQKERAKWEQYLADAIAFEEAGGGTPQSRLQGPNFTLT